MSFVEILRGARRSAAGAADTRLSGLALTITLLVHIGALALMLATEQIGVPTGVFLLTWVLLNGLWLTLLRRPALAAALSLGFIVTLVIASQFKFEVIKTTATFIDVMVVNADTIHFLLSIFPALATQLVILAGLAAALVAILWRIDPWRVARLHAAGVATASLLALGLVSATWPQEPWETFFGQNYVSYFVRSAAIALRDRLTQGYLDADTATVGSLRPSAGASCTLARRPPHIILIHDESSFDIRALADVQPPLGYGAHFLSFDGKERRFVVEGAGGPSWYAEYNVLHGLSARSFGNFAYFVTRIAAGRVHRGLPRALQRCGYKTASLYPALGAFMGARFFHTSAGVDQFLDARALGSKGIEPDAFYYAEAERLIAREHARAPLFVYVYLAANHFPWTTRFRHDLAPEWQRTANDPRVDEYLRRQRLSAQDYRAFLARLAARFPDDSFLLVRYGDHQPDFAAEMIEPGLPAGQLARRFETYDPRYFTTYYALDAINYRPARVASALPVLEAPYLPLVVLEAAGLPLDPSFAEQKRILQRCNGAFYTCREGAEARRFNRLLIDARLIDGL